MPPPYSTHLLTSIQHTITLERLTVYLRATGNNLSQALELYEYNIQLSEALYGLLHCLEVAVRNAEDAALTTSYGTQAWYDAIPLNEYWRDKVTKAKKRPGCATKPGKVVAELTFGFWVNLLSKANHNSLWVGRGLRHAFPNTSKPRSEIHQRLEEAQLIRNRVSHHERILTASEGLYTGAGTIPLNHLVECVDWICHDTAHWMETEFRQAGAKALLKLVHLKELKL